MILINIKRYANHVIVSESAVVGLFQIITIAINFLMTIVLTRFLGLENYGKYQLILSYIAVCQIFALPGQNIIISKGILKKYDNIVLVALKHSIKSTAFFGLIITTISILLFKSGFIDREDLSVTIITALFTLLMGLNKYDNIFQAKNKFKHSRLFLLSQATLNITVTGLIAQLTGSILYTIIALFVIQAITTMAGLYTALSMLKKTKFNPELEKQLLSESTQYSLLSIFTLTSSQIDKLVIGHLDPKLLAIYSIGSFIPKRIKDNLKTLLAIPVLHAGKMSRKENEAFIRRHISKLFFLSIPLVIFVWLFSPIFFPLAYGANYHDSIWIASWLSLSIPLMLAALLINSFDIYQNDGTFYRRQQLVRLVVNLLAISCVSYYFGLLGLVVAVVSIEIVFSLNSIAFFYLKLHLPTSKSE